MTAGEMRSEDTRIYVAYQPGILAWRMMRGADANDMTPAQRERFNAVTKAMQSGVDVATAAWWRWWIAEAGVVG